MALEHSRGLSSRPHADTSSRLPRPPPGASGPNERSVRHRHLGFKNRRIPSPPPATNFTGTGHRARQPDPAARVRTDGQDRSACGGRDGSPGGDGGQCAAARGEEVARPGGRRPVRPRQQVLAEATARRRVRGRPARHPYLRRPGAPARPFPSHRHAGATVPAFRAGARPGGASGPSGRACWANSHRFTARTPVPRRPGSVQAERAQAASPAADVASRGWRAGAPVPGAGVHVRCAGPSSPRSTSRKEWSSTIRVDDRTCSAGTLRQSPGASGTRSVTPCSETAS